MKRHAPSPSRGFSLVELITSLAILSVLVVAMGSALVISMRSLDGRETPTARIGDEVLDDIVRDLRLATIFTERTENAVTFSVPDRDGDGDPEIIGYEWRGQAGDPLQRTYNGRTATLVEHVDRFDLSYLSRVVDGSWVDVGEQRNLSVMMVVERATNLQSEEAARVSLIESWGYSVAVIDDGASDSAFEAAVGIHDVVFVPYTAKDVQIGSALTNLPVGIVSEQKAMARRLAIEADNRMEYNDDEIEIVDASHYLTSGLSGRVPIFSHDVDCVMHDGVIAPGAVVLASRATRPTEAALVVIEAGGQLVNGNPAPTRRVLLPWGDNIPIADLTRDGSKLLRRSIDWVAFNESAGDEESDELLLAYHDGAGGALADAGVDGNQWPGQFVRPLLPTNTVTWKVTRVKLQLAGHRDPDGVARVQLRGADGEGRPTAVVHDSVTFLESSLSGGGYLWIEFSLDSPELAPTDGICIVVEGVSGERLPLFSVQVEEQASTAIPAAHRLNTVDAGVSWTVRPEDQLQFYLYGNVSTVGPPEWP